VIRSVAARLLWQTEPKKNKCHCSYETNPNSAPRSWCGISLRHLCRRLRWRPGLQLNWGDGHGARAWIGRDHVPCRSQEVDVEDADTAATPAVRLQKRQQS
jgi:hypothetical protein